MAKQPIDVEDTGGHSVPGPKKEESGKPEPKKAEQRSKGVGDEVEYYPSPDFALDLIAGGDHAYEFGLAPQKGRRDQEGPTPMTFMEVSRHIRDNRGNQGEMARLTPLKPRCCWKGKILELSGDGKTATLEVKHPNGHALMGIPNVPHDPEGKKPHSWR